MDSLTAIINWFSQVGVGAPVAFTNMAGDIFSQLITGDIGFADVPTATWNTFFGSLAAIPDLFSSVAFYTWSSILLVFPDGGTFPQPVHDAAIYFGDALSKTEFMFPVDDFITVLLLSISVQFALSVYFFGMYLIRFIRGQ